MLILQKAIKSAWQSFGIRMRTIETDPTVKRIAAARQRCLPQ